MLLTSTEKRVIARHNEMANLHQIAQGIGQIALLDYAIGKRLHYGAWANSGNPTTTWLARAWQDISDALLHEWRVTRGW